jgi:SAM-dependent methyltransferase
MALSLSIVREVWREHVDGRNHGGNDSGVPWSNGHRLDRLLPAKGDRKPARMELRPSAGRPEHPAMNDGKDLMDAARFVFDDGAAYERMMGRWSALIAVQCLDWLALPHGLAWLDVGCGDGSFTEVLMARQDPSSVVGVDPSPAQLAFARRRIGTSRADFLEGNAQAIPLPDSSVDAALMALVLFFLPEPARALRELVRVVRPGGTIAAYHWDLAGGGLPLEPVNDALRAEGQRSRPPPAAWAASLPASRALWRDAGLMEVQTCRIEATRTFESFEAFWEAAIGSPRLRDVFGTLPPGVAKKVRERVYANVGAALGEPLSLRAAANAVKGVKR